MLKTFFTKKWILPTLLVPLAVALMVRLGFWQLDRLDQRQAHNQQVVTMLDADAVEISAHSLTGENAAVTADDLLAWEYRDAIVRGEYDHQREMIVRNQTWEQQLGVHLLTPLKISGTDQAVLVDRGWIPLEDYQQGRWKNYTEPGEQEIRGMIRSSQSPPALGGQDNPTPQPGKHIAAWNFIDIKAIERQLPYSLLPMYIQLAPDGEEEQLPYRRRPEFELTPGPHLGYAIQWFAFAAVLGFGYPLYVYRQEEIKA